MWDLAVVQGMPAGQEQKLTSKTALHGPPFMNLHHAHSSLASLAAAVLLLPLPDISCQLLLLSAELTTARVRNITAWALQSQMRLDLQIVANEKGRAALGSFTADVGGLQMR